MAGEKKGITVQIDADLHAEVRQYLEQHGMTMAEFVTLALDDELHPKHQRQEEQKMGNMRTLAFQVPEELFQKIKGYLARNNMTQKEFVIGLIETELEREQTELEAMTQDQSEEETMGQDEAAMDDASNQFADEDTLEESQDMEDSDYIEESEDENLTEAPVELADDSQDIEIDENSAGVETGDEDAVLEDEPEDEAMDETQVDIPDEIQSEEAGEMIVGLDTGDEDTALEDDLEETENEEMDEAMADILDESQNEDIEYDMDYEDEEETEYQGFSMGM